MKKPFELETAETRLSDIRARLRSIETERAAVDASVSVRTQNQPAFDAKIVARRVELDAERARLLDAEQETAATVLALKNAFVSKAAGSYREQRRDALQRYAGALTNAEAALADLGKVDEALRYCGVAVRKPIPAPYLAAAARSARELAEVA